MNNKRYKNVNKIKYILTIIIIISALLSSIVPVYAEGAKKPTVSKPSVGSAPIKTEDKYAEDDKGLFESLFEEDETKKVITDNTKEESSFGSLFENAGENEESTAEDSTTENSGAEITGDAVNSVVFSVLSMLLNISRYMGVLCLSFGLIRFIMSMVSEDSDAKFRSIGFIAVGVILVVLKSLITLFTSIIG